MKQTLIALFLCGSVMSATAAGGVAPDAKAQEAAAVLAEFSQRSGLSEEELNGWLADCDSSQQSMYFCAYRDVVAAERAFRRALTEKAQRLPKCKTSLESKAASWIQARDRSCEKSAKQDYGGGSMEPTAKLICMSSSTESMTKRLKSKHKNNCTFPQ